MMLICILKTKRTKFTVAFQKDDVLLISEKMRRLLLVMITRINHTSVNYCAALKKFVNP